MSAEAYTSGTSWSWPKTEFMEDIDSDVSQPELTPQTSSVADTDKSELSGGEHTPDTEGSPSEPPRPQRVYPSRTCRICLEVVEPTYTLPLGGLGGMLSPTPTVEYISSEPGAGRLIRPCKCKGSQRYVHEGCLQEWRHADPAYGRRNFWQCPTCHFKYRLERMQWSRWISSTATQIALTITILLTTVFVLGFVADPIINLYLDPVSTLTTNPLNAPSLQSDFLDDDEELSGWAFHLIKGLTSLGLLGFVKVFFAMSPWQAYYYRSAAFGGGRGRGGTGRDRLENISWTLVLIGVGTFLWVCLMSLDKATY